MFRFFANLILIKILKWKVVGSFPKIPKFVIAVFPHTSNYDFFVGIFIRSVLREEINYVGKKELFNPLTSWFFKGLGGAPLSREGNQNVVESIVKIYNQRKTFRLAIAPEGTRKPVSEWKTGFYYIAKGAQVPILLVGFDYSKRTIHFFPLFTPTDDIKKDYKTMKSYFVGIKGKNPENGILNL
ncbi:1-acyl-sn-glycerol-3-phosphate acyltransferase [Flavobacteriaceae bacterium]|nr:1-acyl-sn-glycerol-3-phosphate acyltransferase [Flavobacteriaceae bacterium]